MTQPEIPNYPTSEELEDMETDLAFGQITQAIISLNPETSYCEIKKAVGSAKTPDQASCNLRDRLPPDCLKNIVRPHQE